jgi:molybdenum-dependent DNA-binding transcriptional regulator ModE
MVNRCLATAAFVCCLRWNVGGESQLTAETRELLKNFRLLREQVNIAADNYFAEVFPADG